MKDYSLQALVSDGFATPLCPTPAAGHAHCDSLALTAAGTRKFSDEMRAYADAARKSDDGTRNTLATLPTSGFGPSDFQSWYGLTADSAAYGKGSTVGIVIAGDAPIVEADLAVFRSHFGLPACTTANGCFKRVDGNGGTNLPPYGSWAAEVALDVDMVSDICPLCNITIIEAASDSLADLATAQGGGVAAKVSAIGNSWGVSETGMASYASKFSHPGTPITAAAGNSQYSSVQEVPAAFSTVTAVGGTFPNILPPYREGAWSGTVGCSTIVAKPAWQKDTACSTRTVADVAFQAAYIATYTNGLWYVSVGTSAPAQAIAALYAMVGSTVNDASALYASSAGLYNVADGFDGPIVANSAGTPTSCNAPSDESNGIVSSFAKTRKALAATSPLYLCSGVVGYNAPTGNGTPNGICGFATSCSAVIAPVPGGPTPAPGAPGATPAPACPAASTGPGPAHPTPRLNGPGGCTS